jgi:SAM-dependent methyltransferase
MNSRYEVVQVGKLRMLSLWLNILIRYLHKGNMSDTLKGHSIRNGKPETAEWFRQHQDSIHRILDIGCGSGTYPRLIKQEFGLCKDSEWVGVEAWASYITEFKLESLYDRVINCDARELDWSDMGHFDVAIAGDVLEHMTKQQAIDLVESVLDHSNWLIISIPIRYMPQDDIDGNPFEVHVKPDWTHEEVVDTWAQYIKQTYRKSVKSKLAVYWLSR